MNKTIPSIEWFKEKAATVYEKQRDESKASAIISIAEGLLDSYCAGAEYMAASTEERTKFIQSVPKTVA